MNRLRVPMMRPNRTISDMAWQAGLMQSTHAPNPEGLNILCLIHDSVTACEEYRVIQPMQEMERAGHNVYLMNATAHAARLKQRIDDTVGADLVLVNRINTEEGMENVYNVVMQNIRKRGTSGVVDFDDDFRNVHREVHPGVMPALDRFSAITVTTDVLKTAYGGLNKHIYVLPNLIQLERFDKAPREINGLVIGLTGSQTHRLDWQPAAVALRRILDEHPEVKAFVSGYMPAELRGHPQVLTPGMVRKEYIADSDLLVPYKHYPWVVKQIDILLCPVDPEDRFNWYKSPLKVLEGWAAGCAVVATGAPLPIYASVMTPDTGLLTFHTVEGYYNALKYLVERPDVTAFLRESGRKEAQKWASEHVNRERIYRTIIDRDRRLLVESGEGQVEHYPCQLPCIIKGQGISLDTSMHCGVATLRYPWEKFHLLLGQFFVKLNRDFHFGLAENCTTFYLHCQELIDNRAESRYNDGMKLTFQKIGDMLGISRQRAHQLYRKGRITIEVRDGKHFVVWQKEQITRKRSVYSVDDMVQNEKVR